MKFQRFFPMGLVLGLAVATGTRSLAAETLVFANTSDHRIRFAPIPGKEPPPGTVKAKLGEQKPPHPFAELPGQGITIPVNGFIYLEIEAGPGSKGLCHHFEVRGVRSHTRDRSHRFCTLALQTHPEEPGDGTAPGMPVTLKAVPSRTYSAELTMKRDQDLICFFDGFIPNRRRKPQSVPSGFAAPDPVQGTVLEDKELGAVLKDKALGTVLEDKELEEALDAILESAFTDGALPPNPQTKQETQETQAAGENLPS